MKPDTISIINYEAKRFKQLKDKGGSPHDQQKEPLLVVDNRRRRREVQVRPAASANLNEVVRSFRSFRAFSNCWLKWHDLKKKWWIIDSIMKTVHWRDLSCIQVRTRPISRLYSLSHSQSRWHACRTISESPRSSCLPEISLQQNV